MPPIWARPYREQILRPDREREYPGEQSGVDPVR